MRQRVILIAAIVAAACGRMTNESERFETMTAAEHRAAAAREHRAADEEYEQARDALREDPRIDYPDAPTGPYGLTPFYDPSWDPIEPEHYIVDERARVPGEDHADAGRRHRERAERHEAAAEQLERARVE
jgi:hypothetical protein